MITWAQSSTTWATVLGPLVRRMWRSNSAAVAAWSLRRLTAAGVSSATTLGSSGICSVTHFRAHSVHVDTATPFDTECGEHVGDIVTHGAAPHDDQDATGVEAAVFVGEVGDSVERHRGLARSGRAAEHHHTAVFAVMRENWSGSIRAAISGRCLSARCTCPAPESCTGPPARSAAPSPPARRIVSRETLRQSSFSRTQSCSGVPMRRMSPREMCRVRRAVMRPSRPACHHFCVLVAFIVLVEQARDGGVAPVDNPQPVVQARLPSETHVACDPLLPLRRAQ